MERNGDENRSERQAVRVDDEPDRAGGILPDTVLPARWQECGRIGTAGGDAHLPVYLCPAANATVVVRG